MKNRQEEQHTTRLKIKIYKNWLEKNKDEIKMEDKKEIEDKKKTRNDKKVKKKETKKKTLDTERKKKMFQNVKIQVIWMLPQIKTKLPKRKK